jgi:integrase
MALTDIQIRKAIPSDKQYKLNDGGGLSLLVRPTGTKSWVCKIRIHGKEQRLTFGTYPLVSLREARARRDEAKLELMRGGDPIQRRRQEKLAAQLSAGNLFEEIAEEFIAKREAEGLAPATLKKLRYFLDLLRKPIGKRPIAEITPHELLASLKKIENKGNRESAKRTRSFASRVFRYGVATARCDTDPAHLLSGSLLAPIPKSYAAIVEPEKVGELLKAIDRYEGYPPTMYALRILPRVFVRPGELRLAEWGEFDLANSVWQIPVGRMKARRPHAVPLSSQVVELLKDLREKFGDTGYVFRSLHARAKPISENTLNQALRRMGYSSDEMTSHGFRSTASTLLNESGLWSPDAIERALAHQDANAIRGIYHRGAHWEERVKMAQWWSDHLDALKAGTTTVAG